MCGLNSMQYAVCRILSFLKERLQMTDFETAEIKAFNFGLELHDLEQTQWQSRSPGVEVEQATIMQHHYKTITIETIHTHTTK